MILLDSAASDRAIIPEIGVFAGQLEAAGVTVTLARERIPENLTVTQRFDLLRFTRDTIGTAADGMIIIAADIEDEAQMAAFRKVSLSDAAPVLALGRFETRQEQIAAETRLGYVLGRGVKSLNLSDLRGVVAGKRACPCFGVDIPDQPAPFLRGRRPIKFIAPNALKAGLFPALQLIDGFKDIVPVTYTTSADKEAWVRFDRPGHQVYAFSEMTAAEFTALGGMVIVTAPPASNYRILSAINNHIAKGALIVDATPDGNLVADGVPALRGPADLAYLPAYLRDVVLPNEDGVMSTVPATPLAQTIRMDRFLEETDFAPAKPKPAKKTKGRVNFLPTNGVGLGHAQRCSLVAREIPKSLERPRFFAFPSCLPMIRRFGFDATPLVSRTDMHEARAANDLLNYARLTMSVSPEDVLVFDGGYVFSSVLRTVMDHRMRSVWIRRGLWKKEQDNSGPLDREKVFSRVIVPTEALGDLNESYSHGDHIYSVGPIVQQVPDSVSRDEIREKIKEEFDFDFERLIVTMLGSGVMSDRTAHAQAVANHVECRDDALNLMVVWPTAYVPPAWYGWERTRVVQTHHAALLLKAADLFVSAVGFNSFHESLYNGVPALFVPQEATALDDQTKRAEMADEMGLAGLLREGRIGLMDRELTRLLDRGKADDIRKAIAAHDLPEPGNVRAAELIAELLE